VQDVGYCKLSVSGVFRSILNASLTARSLSYRFLIALRIDYAVIALRLRSDSAAIPPLFRGDCEMIAQ
jgi:hypothetical protein